MIPSLVESSQNSGEGELLVEREGEREGDYRPRGHLIDHYGRIICLLYLSSTHLLLPGIFEIERI